jgi:5-methylcytosine-specific restriction endonuclease McrA
VSDPLTLPVLVLNRFFQPVRITTLKRAIVLVYAGVAAALDEDGDSYPFADWRQLPVRAEDDGLPILSGVLRVPRVVHLQRYERVPRVAVRLSRANVMLRDEHQCQYCGRKPADVRDLNLDHVFPRSRGGTATWENLVTSCHPCNRRKGSRTPDEAHMRLARLPSAPKWVTSLRLAAGRRGEPDMPAR